MTERAHHEMQTGTGTLHGCRRHRPRHHFAAAIIALQALAVAGCSCKADAAAAGAQGEQAPKRWNIVAIIPDDHSMRAMGAYGDEQAVTPNLDRLARQGARFSSAYAAAPVCSPSRAAFFSGRFPSQVEIHDFFIRNPHYAQRGLAPSAVLWPEVLQQHGYATGLIGKWHLGEADRYHPTKQGFGYFLGYDYGVEPNDPALEVDGKVRTVAGHTSDIFAEAAEAFLERHRDEPFALTIAFREPQEPWHVVPARDRAAVAQVDPAVPSGPGMNAAWLKERTRANYAAIHALDRSVGRVLEAIERLGLTQRTIVVYVGDNGMLIGHHGLFGRGAVGVVAGDHVLAEESIATLHEDAIRIPLLIHWPGVTQPGTVIDTPVSNVDLFPTILSMTGVAMPASARLEGRDLTTLFSGDANAAETPVFAQYDMENFGRANLRMVRFGKWKLVRRFGLAAGPEAVDELYDLDADPSETRNLIGAPEHRKVLEDLRERLARWQRSIVDPVLRGSDAPQVFVPGGTFEMGADDGYADEAPRRRVHVAGFWIDRHEATNAQFARFVHETGYVTLAERSAGSAVFVSSARGSSPDRKPAPSWKLVRGASWRHPEGPGSSVVDRGNFPVVQLAFEDAQAYARWAGRTLPTEEQWEYAARAGFDGGHAITPAANTWQGPFPEEDTGADGFKGIAPVGQFPPNAFGLHDMIGNVWEWTTAAPGSAQSASQSAPLRIIKGGSFLCSPSYCLRARPAARYAQDTGLGTNHIGFRTISSEPPRGKP